MKLLLLKINIVLFLFKKIRDKDLKKLILKRGACGGNRDGFDLKAWRNKFEN